MKQAACYGLRLFLLSLLLVGNSSAETCKVLRSGSYSWNPVYLPATDQKAQSRLGYELLKAISTSLNIPYEIQPKAPFSKELIQLMTGQLDIVMGLYPTDKRRQMYHFSLPYYQEPLHVFTPRDKNLQINSLANMEGLVGVMIRGASYGQTLDEYFATQAEVVRVTLNKRQVSMIKEGRADYLINSPYQGNDILQDSDFVMSEKPLAGQMCLSPCQSSRPVVI